MSIFRERFEQCPLRLLAPPITQAFRCLRTNHPLRIVEGGCQCRSIPLSSNLPQGPGSVITCAALTVEECDTRSDPGQGPTEFKEPAGRIPSHVRRGIEEQMEKQYPG